MYQDALALHRTHEHALCGYIFPSLTTQREGERNQNPRVGSLGGTLLLTLLAQGKPRTKFEEWGVASLGDGVASWEHGVI